MSDNYIHKFNCTECNHKSICFNTLLNNELEFINKNKIQIHFSPGEILGKQGTFISYIMFVTKGIAKQYIEGGGQKKQAIKLTKTGDYIGLSNLQGSKLYHYSTIAIKDTEVCMIERDSILKIISKNVSFANEIIKVLSSDQVQLFNTLRNSSLKQTNGKMASILLYLSSEQFGDETIFRHLTRKDIADFAGISLESSIKILKEFEHENIIKTDKKDIEILNREALQKIEHYG
jgi:CRP/FNR family transcriptional regulator